MSEFRIEEHTRTEDATSHGVSSSSEVGDAITSRQFLIDATNLVPPSAEALLDRVEELEAALSGAYKAIEELRLQASEKDETIERLKLESLCDNQIDFVLNKRGVKFAFDLIQEQMQEEDVVLMLFLDINGFGNINKAITETRADMVIAGYADHLVRQVREGDIVGRLGGDEFCILVNLNGIEDVDEYIKRFVTPINVPYEVNGGYSHREIHSSVGYTRISQNTLYHDAVLAANIGANYIKNNGRRGVAFKSVYEDEVLLRDLTEVNQRKPQAND